MFNLVLPGFSKKKLRRLDKWVVIKFLFGVMLTVKRYFTHEPMGKDMWTPHVFTFVEIKGWCRLSTRKNLVSMRKLLQNNEFLYKSYDNCKKQRLL